MLFLQSNWWDLLISLFAPRESKWSTNWNQYLDEVTLRSSKPRIKLPDLEKNSVIYLNKIWVATDYSSKIMTDLIWQTKRGGQWAIANEMADLIKITYDKFPLGIPSPSLITWAPADPARLSQRGYHLPELIAVKLASEMNTKTQELVTKNRSTKAQGELSRQERLNNLSKVFAPAGSINKQNLKVRTVWIVDDIVTTGTTLNEVAKVIKKQMPWARIYAVVLAGN